MIKKVQNRNALYTLLFTLMVITFWCVEQYWHPNANSTLGDYQTQIFDKSLLPKAQGLEVVYHQYFSLGYSEPHEQAAWVAWELLPSHLSNDDRKRPYFEIDEKVPTGAAHWNNYKGSGFDRGHLCPAGDRRFSAEAYKGTFLTSNISPQKNDFNAGIWNRLEIVTREWCKKYGPLMVITGGVLKSGLQEIGEEGVDVPEAFYKIILRKSDKGTYESIAFLVPHKESTAQLKNFLTSIDFIEDQVQIDFFATLPDDVENRLESSIRKSLW